MSSRSEKDRYLPDTGASSIGGIPPACRNHRDPTGADTPHATAASSLVSPAAICTQNARSRSRRTGGRPGDRITARPVNAAAQPGGRPIESTSISEVLRPPVEPGQYTSAQFAAFTHRHDLARSVGRTGVWDNAAAESFWAFGRIALRKPHLRRLPIEGEGRSALRQAECRLAIAQPRRERPALKLAPLENRVVLLDEGAGSLPVVGGLAAVDVVGRLEV